MEQLEQVRTAILWPAVILVALINPGTEGWNDQLQGLRQGYLIEIPLTLFYYFCGLFVPFISSVAIRVTVGLIVIKAIIDIVIVQRSGWRGGLHRYRGDRGAASGQSLRTGR